MFKYNEKEFCCNRIQKKRLDNKLLFTLLLKFSSTDNLYANLQLITRSNKFKVKILCVNFERLKTCCELYTI